METPKNIVVGIGLDKRFFSMFTESGKVPYEILIAHLSMTENPRGRLLLALKQFLEQKFRKVDIFTVFERNKILANGTCLGLIGHINRSEVDVGATPLIMDEENTVVRLDFSYPYEISDYTFVTEPPEYVPRIFGIFQTFNVSVWLTLAAVFITLGIMYYFILKRKSDLRQILLHIFAVLMKQSALIFPSSFAEKILFHSWVLGAMILGLSYESVFLSFLSFPPVTKIKHLSDLASAVQKGKVRCIGAPYSYIYYSLLQTNKEDFRAIADDVLETYPRREDLLTSFVKSEKRTNLVFLTETSLAQIYAAKNFFVSEDRFFPKISGIPMRKNFCCKHLIDAFVHRMMASGIYHKYYDDRNFHILHLYKNFGKIVSKRKMTLTDVAPAFIFLIGGHSIALIVLIYEIVSNRWNVRGLKLAAIKRRKKCLEKIPLDALSANCFV